MLAQPAAPGASAQVEQLELPARPSPAQPVAPTDPALSSKTAEPDPDWKPTANPKSTVVAGQMRSDREEIPAPFTKADADKAETMEAGMIQQQSARGITAFNVPVCQVYWPSPFQVCGEIRDKYNSLGGPASFLTFPTSGNITNPDGIGQRVTFLNGPIYWSPQGGAHPVVNSFLNRWGIHQYEAGWLGYPTTDEIVHVDGVGRRQEFEHGAIYVAFVNAIGSAIANGAIRDYWNGLGAHSGRLGYLTSDEIIDGVMRYHHFSGGIVYFSTISGVQEVKPAFGLTDISQPDDEKCYIPELNPECYADGGFEEILDRMDKCKFDPAVPGGSDNTWGLFSIKHPTGAWPEISLNCARYRHITNRHDAHYDPENFLMGVALVYNLGTESTNTAPGNRRIVWTNPNTGVEGNVIFQSDAGGIRGTIITAYAGPDNGDDQRGDNWGGLASGYIEDRPAPF